MIATRPSLKLNDVPEANHSLLTNSSLLVTVSKPIPSASVATAVSLLSYFAAGFFLLFILFVALPGRAGNFFGSVVTMLNFLRLLSFSSGVLAATLPLELHSYVNPLAFDNGDYGSYPVETFVSSHLTPPRLAEMEGSPPDDDGMHIFFSPRGHQVKQQGPTILDEAGNLVWMSYEYDQVYALMSQEYNGERYITFWSGNDGIGGHGAGTYIIVSIPCSLHAESTHLQQDITDRFSSIHHIKRYADTVLRAGWMETFTSFA